MKFPGPAAVLIVVLVWLQAPSFAQSVVLDFVHSEDRSVLARWLSANPEWRLATDRDCWFWNWNANPRTKTDCREGLDRIRTTESKDYQPYYLSADLNGDGTRDIAVFMVSRTDPDRGQIVIFNGPAASSRSTVPAFTLDNSHPYAKSWAFGYFAFHYGPPRPRPYRLLVGEWEAERAIIEPDGKGYRVRW